MLVTHVLYGPLMLYGVSNFLLYGLCIYVWLNVWTMCWTICGVVILRTYVFLCLFISYMLCLNIFYLCFQFYMAKVCIMSMNQWEQYVWFLFILLDFFEPKAPVLSKTDPVNQQTSWFSGFQSSLPIQLKKIPIWILYRFCWFSVKPTKPVRSSFWGYTDFWNHGTTHICVAASPSLSTYSIVTITRLHYASCRSTQPYCVALPFPTRSRSCPSWRWRTWAGEVDERVRQLNINGYNWKEMFKT
jgi:hypothetical protein